MDQLILKYDYLSFAEEHKNEFYPYTGSYEELKKAEEIFLWEWPDSDYKLGSMDSSFFNEGYEFEYAYTGLMGNEWGFIEYWRGVKNAWICINKPSTLGIYGRDEAQESDVPFNDSSVDESLGDRGSEPDVLKSADTIVSAPINEQAPKSDILRSDVRNGLINGFSTLVIIIILIIAVVAGTVILIKVFWKPN
jgi:hypothetical protein